MHEKQPRIIDGREMQPPEPLERTLAALDELEPGDELRLLVWHHPRPLYQILDRNGYPYASSEHGDGTVEVTIRMPAS